VPLKERIPKMVAPILQKYKTELSGIFSAFKELDVNNKNYILSIDLMNVLHKRNLQPEDADILVKFAQDNCSWGWRLHKEVGAILTQYNLYSEKKNPYGDNKPGDNTRIKYRLLTRYLQ
jgi:hypothetical protein